MRTISIITVTLNCAKTIERTIQSVLSQDYPFIEYVIIDGASTDGTVDILRKYDKQLAYWESTPDQGIYDAMNKALRHVTGDLVNFQGGDDFLYDGKVCTKVAQAFDEEECDLLFGLSDFSGKRIARYDFETLDDLLLRSAAPHSALFAKRDVFKEIGNFNTSYQVVADYEWLLRVVIAGKKIRTFEQMVSVFSLGGISSSVTNLKELLYVQTKIAKEQQRYYLLPQIFSRFHAMMCDYIFKVIVNSPTAQANNMMRKLLGDVARVTVWGIGEQGKECVRILHKLGILVGQIIDSDRNKQCTCYEGIPICGYNEMTVYEYIVVTPMQSRS